MYINFIYDSVFVSTSDGKVVLISYVAYRFAK